jgi:hypothetical protein
MINIIEVRGELVRLAEEVEVVDYPASIRLRHLGDAIVGNSETGAWAKADIYQLISPDSIIEQYKRKHLSPGGLIQTLELIRNIFIFLPIIVTWLGISQATSAYHALLDQCLKLCPDQVSQPFLFLWEQGFGGRIAAVFKLSNIGLIDASILAIIFTLTLFVTLLSIANNRRQEREAQHLYARFINVLAQSSLALLTASAPMISPSDSLDSAAKQIDAMSRHVLNSFNTIATNIGAQFDAVANKIETRFAIVTQQFEALAQGLSRQFTTIENEFARQLGESNRHLQALGHLVGSTNQLAQEIRTAADSLRDASEEVSQNLNLLVGPVKDLANQQQGLLDAANQSVSYLREAARKLSDLDAQQKQLVDQFLDTIGEFDIAIGTIDTVVSTIGDVNSQQKQFLAELEQERQEQAKLSKSITDATIGVKEALDDMHDGAVAIRSVVVDMNDTLRLQKSMTNAGSMDISAIVNGFTSAAQTIEKSGQELSDSATIMYNAGLALKNAIADLKAALKP